MEKLVLAVLSIGILFSSCNKEDDNTAIENFRYEATVISQGLDCGETFIVSLKSIGSDTGIEDGTYYADNLDPDLNIKGLKINLNCREPNDDELYACTTLGLTYSHIVVTESKKAED